MNSGWSYTNSLAKDWLFLLFWLSTLIVTVNGSKILLVPVQQRANIRELALLSEDLVLNGHEVYIITGSTYTESDMLVSLGIQVLSFHVARYQPMLYSPEVENDFADSIFRRRPEEDILVSMSDIGLEGCELIMRDSGLLDELRKLHFDLAIVDSFNLAPCTAIVPHFLGIPFITKDADPIAIHQPVLPSFVPSSRLNYKDRMTFIQRIINTIHYILNHYIAIYPGLHDISLLTQYSTCYRDWYELLRQGLLHISTTDHHLSYPLPMLPNHIQLPGVTWRPPKPLTNPIFKIIDLAPEGAVVISFGSAINALPAEYLYKMFAAFQRFPGLVFIIKLDQNRIYNMDVPNNVMSLPWLPLNDLLGHSRARLFITHCGRNVVHESVYHGVPILCFPLLTEDNIMSERLLDLGLGRQLDLFAFTSDLLEDTLLELLKNKLYQENVQHTALMLKAQKFNPTETVAYWVEHLLQFGGSHLRSEAMNMTTTQFSMLDIGFAFYVTLTVGFWFSYLYTKFLMGIIWKPKKKKKRCEKC